MSLRKEETVMVKLNKIYTKNGDSGSTQLVGGERVSKSDLRVESYGTVDELNSYLGLCRTLALRDGEALFEPSFMRIQNELFDLGSELAANADSLEEYGMPVMKQDRIQELESDIDKFNAELPELKSFVLPGGTELNSHLHIARTVCRRAERSTVALSESVKINPLCVTYLNRLSDLLFVMARKDSQLNSKEEFLWVPGKTSK